MGDSASQTNARSLREILEGLDCVSQHVAAIQWAKNNDRVIDLFGIMYVVDAEICKTSMWRKKREKPQKLFILPTPFVVKKNFQKMYFFWNYSKLYVPLRLNYNMVGVKYSLQYGMTGQCWQGKTSCVSAISQCNSLNFNILPPPYTLNTRQQIFVLFCEALMRFAIFVFSRLRPCAGQDTFPPFCRKCKQKKFNKL